ncbi:DnaD domain-containing protein [Metabacillus iocasae]|uniref:DNA replication protein n=1 Tax=Priestia iocasae TaxID=2291674 RepID=A0ABS2QVV2_9BACI|nr:DnaD domain-containing protein [Metabacillus iocasae]MBM7703323.1 DNA replication protein [Metabacillus iocasae]
MDKENIIEWFEQGSVSIPKLLMNHYAQLGLNEIEFMTLMHIHAALEGGNSFPTPVELSSKMSISSTACMETLRSLIQRGFLTIEQHHDQSSMITETYSLKPLWEKLIYFMMKETQHKTAETQQQTELDLYSIFEKEFGRPLSPFECETLTMWVDQDHHDIVIIKAALREAVMSGKLNFRYIDRILFEWKKNGIKTIEQARSYGRKFRQHQQPQKKSSAVEKEAANSSVPFFNWLEQ